MILMVFLAWWCRRTVIVKVPQRKSNPIIMTLSAVEAPQSESDWQIKAQYLSPVVVRRAHSGVAESPLGTSLGQLPELLHLGLQKSPDKP